MGADGMSERQHVSDAAWEALSYKFGLQKRDVANDHYRNGGVVVITVAEHDELLADRDTYRDALGLRAEEFDALRAEVERLRGERAKDQKFIKAFGYLTTLHPTMEIDMDDAIGMASKVVEYVRQRLRKGVMPDDSVRPAGLDAVAGAASAKTRTEMDAVGVDGGKATVAREYLDYSGGGRVSVPVGSIISSPKVQQQVKVVERLRKGRDDGADRKRERLENPGVDIARGGVSARGVGLLVGADFQLDHRLGTK